MNRNTRRGKLKSAEAEQLPKTTEASNLNLFKPGQAELAMESETASSADEHQAVGSAADTRGKHRILAELKRVEQESRFLEEEMEELERMDNVSTLSEELLLSTETRPDPLLPLTNGPMNPSWDRWFEGPQDSQGCGCQIL